LNGKGSDVFVGVYDRSIDDNGRLGLPAPFRGELGDRCYATLDPQGCITVRTAATFEAEAAEIIESVQAGAATPGQRRALATNTITVAIDKQGRITLEEKAREFAGLASGQQATIVGNLSTFEIWRPSRYSTIAGEDLVATTPRQWSDE
jgi:MraZ protein